MKDMNFKVITTPFGSASPEFRKIISLAADKEYDAALEMINEYIADTEDVEQKNIAAMMSMQLLALAGYDEIASVLLEALLKKFKARSKARCLCQKTIKIV